MFAVGGGDDEFEAANNLRVVDQDEDYVDQGERPAEGVENGAERLAEQRGSARKYGCEVVAVEETAQVFGFGVLVNEVYYRTVFRWHLGFAGCKRVNYGRELGEFGGYFGQEEVADAENQCADFGQSCQGG